MTHDVPPQELEVIFPTGTLAVDPVEGDMTADHLDVSSITIPDSGNLTDKTPPPGRRRFGRVAGALAVVALVAPGSSPDTAGAAPLPNGGDQVVDTGSHDQSGATKLGSNERLKKGQLPGLRDKEGDLYTVKQIRSFLRRAGLKNVGLQPQVVREGYKLTTEVNGYSVQVKLRNGKIKYRLLRPGAVQKDTSQRIFLRRKEIAIAAPDQSGPGVVGTPVEELPAGTGQTPETPRTPIEPSLPPSPEIERQLTSAEKAELAENYLDKYAKYRIPFMSNTAAHALVDPVTDEVVGYVAAYHGKLRPEMSPREVDAQGQETIITDKPLTIERGDDANSMEVVGSIVGVIVPKGPNSDFALLLTEGASAERALQLYKDQLASEQEIFEAGRLYMKTMPYFQPDNPGPLRQQMMNMKVLSPFHINVKHSTVSPVIRFNVIAAGVNENADGAIPTVGASGSQAVVVIGDTPSTVKIKIAGGVPGVDDFRANPRNAYANYAGYNGPTVRFERQNTINQYTPGIDLGQYDGLVSVATTLEGLNATLSDDGDLEVVKVRYVPPTS